jgi:hypothetical protein
MNDDLVAFFVVFFYMNARLFRFVRMRLKTVAPPLLDFHIQSVPRLIDKVVPILDKQPNLVIRAPRVFARKIQMHRHHPRPAPASDRHQYRAQKR